MFFDNIRDTLYLQRASLSATYFRKLAALIEAPIGFKGGALRR